MPVCAIRFKCDEHEDAQLKNANAIALHGAVWMMAGDEPFGGSSRIALLARIEECGSITNAAKALNMSYKAAWDAINAMNNLAGEALVARQAGGKGGGGTRLTPRGQQLVANFAIIEREHRHFVTQLGQQAQGMTEDFLLIRRMAMKTSARNQFAGTVTKVVVGAVNDEIELRIGDGQTIVAIITHQSTLDLGIKVGGEVIALIKSSWVMLVTGAETARFSARNQLSGTISRVQVGAVNSEVILDMGNGASIVAIITNDSVAALGLVEGSKASALFKASSVILATPI